VEEAAGLGFSVSSGREGALPGVGAGDEALFEPVRNAPMD
jgi:hypothetical protein